MQDGNPAIRIVVEPYGSALPLGFFSFGIDLVLLGGIASAGSTVPT
ncbi:MAG: hypothetical protein ACXVZL_10380 [Gaiellaceae bacterium]